MVTTLSCRFTIVSKREWLGQLHPRLKNCFYFEYSNSYHGLAEYYLIDLPFMISKRKDSDMGSHDGVGSTLRASMSVSWMA